MAPRADRRPVGVYGAQRLARVLDDRDAESFECRHLGRVAEHVDRQQRARPLTTPARGQTLQRRLELQVLATGEDRVAAWYVARGFAVEARNWRTRQGEIDLIARRDGLIVFCEVKCRVANRAGRDPLESVHPSKQAQVRRMAGRWLIEREHPRVRDLRFDAIGITLSPDGKLLRLDHLEAAF